MKSKQRKYIISNALIVGDISFTSTNKSTSNSSDPEEQIVLDGLSMSIFEQQI